MSEQLLSRAVVRAVVESLAWLQFFVEEAPDDEASESSLRDALLLLIQGADLDHDYGK